MRNRLVRRSSATGVEGKAAVGIETMDALRREVKAGVGQIRARPGVRIVNNGNQRTGH